MTDSLIKSIEFKKKTVTLKNEYTNYRNTRRHTSIGKSQHNDAFRLFSSQNIKDSFL